MNAKPAAIGLIFAAFIAVPSAADAWCRTTTQRSRVLGECSMTGVPLAWRSLCTGFSVFIDASPDIALDDIRSAATTAASLWHLAPCDANGSTTPYFQLLPLPDTQVPSGFNRSGVNANTVSFNSVWHPDASHQLGTIAITLVTFDANSGEILDADLEMNQVSDDNPDGFHFTVGMPDLSAADLPTILTHEFGHLHGLGHSTDDAAVMWPQAGLGEQRRMLRSDDVQGICDAYNPAYEPAGLACNPTPYGGFASNLYGGRVRGGCSVERSNGSLARPWRSALFAGLAAIGATTCLRRARTRKP